MKLKKEVKERTTPELVADFLKLQNILQDRRVTGIGFQGTVTRQETVTLTPDSMDVVLSGKPVERAKLYFDAGNVEQAIEKLQGLLEIHKAKKEMLKAQEIEDGVAVE